MRGGDGPEVTSYTTELKIEQFVFFQKCLRHSKVFDTQKGNMMPPSY